MKKILIPLALLGLILLSSCVTPPGIKDSSIISPSTTNSSIFSVNLKKAVKYINQKNWPKAKEALNNLQEIASSNNEKAELVLAHAILSGSQEQFQSAIELLQNAHNQQLLSQAEHSTQQQVNEYLAILLEKSGQPIQAAKQRYKNSAYYADSAKFYQKNHQALWRDLNQSSTQALEQAAATETDHGFKEWIKLALLTLNSKTNLHRQILSINQWHQQNSTHPAAMIPPDELAELNSAYHKIPKRIAVILPFEGKYKNASNAIRDGIMHDYFDQKISQISFFNSDPSLPFMDAYQNAVDSGADLIIGPLLKNHLKELSAFKELPVKTIALNELRDTPLPKNLIQFSLAPEDEIDSLISYANQDNHHRAIVLAENSEWGKNNISYFNKIWQKQGNTTVESATFSSTQSQSQVVKELLNIHNSNRRTKEVEQVSGIDIEAEPRRRQDVDMVVIFAKPRQALAIPPLFNFYYASDLPIYATSSIFKGYNETKFNRDLDGVKITEFPLIVDTPGNIPKKYQQSSLIRMYAFGKDAFALSERAYALENLDSIHIYGATGLLSLSDNKIHRETRSAIFKNGTLQSAGKPNRI